MQPAPAIKSKKDLSKTKQQQDSASKKVFRWDEMNLLETELDKSSIMVIDEPKTPFHYPSLSVEQLSMPELALDAEVLRAKTSQVVDHNKDQEMVQEQEPKEPAEQQPLNFKERMHSHYMNEYRG